MTSLLHSLRERDAFLLPLLAEVWKVNVDMMEPPAMIEVLNRAMLDPARAEIVWDALGERERGALQILITTGGGKMPEARFTPLFGAIRQMGAAQAAKEKPHINPVTASEALYYRGLIGLGFEIADTGQRRIVYIPSDLTSVLPTHKTSYDNVSDEDDEFPITEAEPLPALDKVDNVRAADTSIVDDMTTLLAYLQLHAPLLERDAFTPADGSALAKVMLQQDRARLVFLLSLGAGADLIEVQGGRALPKRTEARRWLGGSRSEQLRKLAEIWRDTAAYVDLWHVPGLVVERDAGTMNQYNPAGARTAVLEIMKHALPAQGWWSVDDFIDMIRQDSADFQRPNSDFDSWYIRNDDGEYLTGLKSWDAVDGALLDYLITSPLHWLGMVDLGEGAARFTAYGRAFLGLNAYPNPTETGEKIEVGADGSLRVSRKVARIDRFQIARFATWMGVDNGVYLYKIDTDSINRASGQGINTGHIAAFVSRATGDAPIPSALANLLNNWKSGAVATVQIERVLVLRTMSPEIMKLIMETPALRRFMGAQLGEMAAIVRADNMNELRDALGGYGIQAEILGG